MSLAKKTTSDLKAFISKSKRVWLVLKKPSKVEYKMVAKITAIGILIIGFVGFLISAVMQIFLGL